MKVRSFSAAIATVALGATGLAVTAPVATAAAPTTATASKTVAANGTTLTVSAFSYMVGSARKGSPTVSPDVASAIIDVPQAYVYRNSFGNLVSAEVEWIVSGTASGDPICAGSYYQKSGKGDGAASWDDWIMQDTAVGACTVRIDLVASRIVDGHPGATYEARLSAEVPLRYYAQAVFSDVKTSTASLPKGSILTISGTLNYDSGYSRASVPALPYAVLDVEETTSSPTSPTATWSKVATTKSAANGTWKVRLKPNRSAAYRVTYRGTTLFVGATTSPTPIIRVTSPAATKLSKPKASPSKVKKGATTTLSGKAYVKSGSKYKGYAKAKVTVQKKVGKKWKTVKTVTASTSGTWKLKVKATTTTTYRTVVKATSSKKAATSGSIKVTVRR